MSWTRAAALGEDPGPNQHHHTVELDARIRFVGLVSLLLFALQWTPLAPALGP